MFVICSHLMSSRITSFSRSSSHRSLELLVIIQKVSRLQTMFTLSQLLTVVSGLETIRLWRSRALLLKQVTTIFPFTNLVVVVTSIRTSSVQPLSKVAYICLLTNGFQQFKGLLTKFFWPCFRFARNFACKQSRTVQMNSQSFTLINCVEAEIFTYKSV